MNREELAEHLASVFLQSSVKWPEIGAHAQAMWLAVADAALSALKGPRTGEELYNAIGSSGVQLLYVWPNVEPTIRTAFNTVAATFSAPPEPEGWPEGFSLAAVNGPGGYREQVDALKSSVQDATDARPCLASHLTPTVRRALRPGLLEILASTGSCSPAEVDEALDDADKMAALLSRVRAVGEF